MDIMVDLETTSTDPSYGAIIQIAAVAFDLETKEVSMNTFDRCLAIPWNRTWSESTYQWWRSEELLPIYCGLVERMEPPKVVLDAFVEWVKQFPGSPRLWAKPSHFEYGFLSSYFSQFNVNNPFHYRNVRDLSSYVEGRGHSASQFLNNIPFEGPKHNAIFDVFHQVRGALEA